VHGLVVLDKPAGMTSHDVVARCRRVFGQRRVGHAGTLDPDATGVLLVGLGQCTRLLRFLTEQPKTYRGEVVLGVETTTLDGAGEVVAQHEMQGVDLSGVEAAAVRFVGPIEQVPPMVSAVRVGGRRLHELAREGREVARPARRVVVHSLQVTPTSDPGVFGLDVACSAGTYVRTLAADLGRALGGGAHLRRLRRLAIGPFSVDTACRLEDLDPSAVLPPAAAVGHLQRVVAGPQLLPRIAHGSVLDEPWPGPGPWAVVDDPGALVAVYELRSGGGGQKPSVVLTSSLP